MEILRAAPDACLAWTLVTAHGATRGEGETHRAVSVARLAYAAVMAQDGAIDEDELERAGLLDGLEGQRRAERLALLAALAAEGAPIEELQRHTAEGTILFLAAERVIGGPRRYTVAEVARETGQSVEFLLAARRAMGLPVPPVEDRAYIDADVEATRMAGVFREAGISEQEIFELLRILGRGLSQSAEAIRSLGQRLALEPGLSESELAQRLAGAAQMVPMLSQVVSNLLTLHLRQMADTETISVAERFQGTLPGSRQVAVCFADLVGFTRLGEEVAPDELSRLAVRLEEMATLHVRPPVRLIKTIGDAVMLASSEPAPLIDVALTLIEEADAEGERFPQLRAGMAVGQALSRAGDWFGRPVNLASRITQIARPGSLLADEQVRDAVSEAFSWSYAGQRRLRGVRGQIALYRARRSAS